MLIRKAQISNVYIRLKNPYLYVSMHDTQVVKEPYK